MEIIPQEQERVKKLRKEHGDKKLGDVTVNMVLHAGRISLFIIKLLAARFMVA